jgi:hypothetical protein
MPSPLMRRNFPRFMLQCVMTVCSLLVMIGAGEAEDWLEKKGRHFLVFYLDDANFAGDVMGLAERYYSQINVDLGLSHVVKRDHVSWLGDKRCRIYLYRNQEEFVKATNSPEWSAGKASYTERIIWSFTGADRFKENILPHEMAHILFREFVGLNNHRVPRWLDEGVAQYVEFGKREEALNLMRAMLEKETYIPIEDLDRMHAAHMGEVDETIAELYYLESASLVHFLISEYGSGRFVDVCSALRDGKTFERALSYGTSNALDSLTELEVEWKAFVLETH